jgi:hypothetical protein
MASLPCADPVPVRLRVDPNFRPCQPAYGDELYPNGIFEFNITRLLAYVGAAERFRTELVALSDMPYAGNSARLNELTIAAADLSRPVILAEIAPGRYSLVDGHHRIAKARRESLPSILAYRVPCPEHVAFLTSTRAYEAYVEYWNSKVDDVVADRALRRGCASNRDSRSVGSGSGSTLDRGTRWPRF